MPNVYLLSGTVKDVHPYISEVPRNYVPKKDQDQKDYEVSQRDQLKKDLPRTMFCGTEAEYKLWQSACLKMENVHDYTQGDLFAGHIEMAITNMLLGLQPDTEQNLHKAFHRVYIDALNRPAAIYIIQGNTEIFKDFWCISHVLHFPSSAKAFNDGRLLIIISENALNNLKPHDDMKYVAKYDPDKFLAIKNADATLLNALVYGVINQPKLIQHLTEPESKESDWSSFFFTKQKPELGKDYDIKTAFLQLGIPLSKPQGCALTLSEDFAAIKENECRTLPRFIIYWYQTAELIATSREQAFNMITAYIEITRLRQDIPTLVTLLNLMIEHETNPSKRLPRSALPNLSKEKLQSIFKKLRTANKTVFEFWKRDTKQWQMIIDTLKINIEFLLSKINLNQAIPKELLTPEFTKQLRTIVVSQLHDDEEKSDARFKNIFALNERIPPAANLNSAKN